MENIEQSGEAERIERVGAGSGPDGPAPTSGDPGHFLLPDLAKSVTRQVQISGPTNWSLLAVGTDSIDLGFYVDWNHNWPRAFERFRKLKERAAGTKGVELPQYLGRGLMMPSGKPPSYALHLLLNGIQVWIAKTQHASNSPNVYVSLPSDRLWHENIGPQVAELKAWISGQGGTVDRVIVSRWDIAADFLLPEGLTSDFLKAHVVTRSRKRREDGKGDRLETFYVGQGTGAIQLRIYDKVAEIVAGGGKKNWFFELWKTKPGDQVWRVEYQLRRLALKQFGAKELADLPELAPRIWNALTDSVVSFRLPDNENASRRTVHPWWSAVQSVGEDLGSSVAAHRDTKKGGTAPVDWYIAHAAGCLAGYAARVGLSKLSDALDALVNDILAYWALRDFLAAYRINRFKLNLPVEDNGEGHGQEVPS